MKYLHFGAQCPGWRHMEAGAREAAAILGYAYESIAVDKHPALAAAYKMYFPGLIVIDDFSIPFPGSGAQLVESFKRRGPLPGGGDFSQLPAARCDQILPLSPDNLDLLEGVCIPRHRCQGWTDKQTWLRGLDLPIYGCAGLKDGKTVAVVEVLPIELVPYPLPRRPAEDGFIACLYGRVGESRDYRRDLLSRGVLLLAGAGYRSLSVVAGKQTPYPNGPLPLLEAVGFRSETELGKILLRHRWDEIVFMTRRV
ncbi:MAG: hypothetical protein FH749_15415 [Firmicutes bacterium]|nr:hypothetical protein [Bacillota bacterium]